METTKGVDLFKIFAEDKRMILYRPEWRKFTGSVTATILLQQTIFHWDCNNRQPFFKFKEPCDHKLYKPGDSWTEELGFSRKEFDNAMRKIGYKKSKKRNGSHKFPVEYWIDASRVTFYTINETNLLNCLSSLYQEKTSEYACNNEGCPVTAQRDATKSPKGTLPDPQRDATKSLNGTVDLPSQRDFIKSSKGDFSILQKSVTEKKIATETTTEAAAVRKTSHSSHKQKSATDPTNGKRNFSAEIEARITEVTEKYGRHFEYPENFSDLCRSNEFYQSIKDSSEVLGLLTINLHNAVKKEHVENVLGYARETTRAMLKAAAGRSI